jgi:hypothetical protein
MLDQARIKVRTVDGARTAVMVEGMPPGLLIGHLRTDRPITGIAHVKPFTEEHDEALAELPDVYISSTPTIAREPVRIGEKFFAVEVKHSITGTLRDAAMQIKLFKGNPTELIPAGARMFGIRMRGTAQSDNLDADIVWCYPGPLNAQDRGAKCIARDGSNLSRVVGVWQRFNVSGLAFGSSEPAIQAPLVDRDAIDFGEPIVMEIVVEKIAKRWIGIRTTLDRQSERNKSSQYLEVERANDGNGHVLVGNGMLVLEPIDKDTIRVSEKVPVTVGGDADVDDVIAAQRAFRRGR